MMRTRPQKGRFNMFLIMYVDTYLRARAPASSDTPGAARATRAAGSGPGSAPSAPATWAPGAAA